jgi:hypothetical protein
MPVATKAKILITPRWDFGTAIVAGFSGKIPIVIPNMPLACYKIL